MTLIAVFGYGLIKKDHPSIKYIEDVIQPYDIEDYVEFSTEAEDITNDLEVKASGTEETEKNESKTNERVSVVTSQVVLNENSKTNIPNLSEAENQELNDKVTNPELAEEKDIRKPSENVEVNLIEIPITKENQDIVSQEVLENSQKADLIPLEGNGIEVERFNNVDNSNYFGDDYSFPERMYPYRAMLNIRQQTNYNQVYTNAMNYNKDPFTLHTEVTISELNDVMEAVYNDHPELFWLETQYSYTYGYNGMGYTVQLMFNETINDIDNNILKFNDEVSNIVDMASQYTSDVEKEKFVHDYLVDTVAYNVNAPMNQSAYSAIINGSSVCAGYSRAFQHILMQMGIPTYYCTGYANGEAHAWNIIGLGDYFYNVDSLWNDNIGDNYQTRSYLYFNVPDSEFNKEHIRTGLSVNLPPCNSTEMTYENVFSNNVYGDILASYGLQEEDVIQTLDEYIQNSKQELLQAGVGSSSFTIAVSDIDLLSEIYQYIRDEGYVDGYLEEVVNELGLDYSRVNLQISVDELPDDLFIIKQETDLRTQN
jgi:hypothetical protein